MHITRNYGKELIKNKNYNRSNGLSAKYKKKVDQNNRHMENEYRVRNNKLKLVQRETQSNNRDDLKKHQTKTKEV